MKSLDKKIKIKEKIKYIIDSIDNIYILEFLYRYIKNIAKKA